MDDWQAAGLLGAMGLDSPPPLQLKGEGDSPDRAHEVAAAGLAGGGGAYPHREAIESSFGQPLNATAVIGGAAADACGALNASAYARGNQVGFASAPDLRLAAHEAAHTLQQQEGVQLQAGLGAAGDRYERAADEAAEHVVRGESAAHLFGATTSSPSIAVQRQQVTSRDPGGWQGVVAAIRRNGAVSASPDYRTALRRLEQLSTLDMLRALDELAQIGELEFFRTAAQASASARAQAAFRAVQIARNVRSAPQAAIDALNLSIRHIPLTDQAVVIAHIAQSAGRAGDDVMAEGVVAAIQIAAVPMANAAAAAPNPVGPGNWNPPGNQPIPFYIGNEAHVAIALQYVALHAGQQVFTNSIPFSTIFGQIPGANRRGLTPEQLAMRPDIANLTMRQLYEIKPIAAAGQAEAQLNIYLGLFRAAGVPMAAGSQSEPGTSGVLPAPGGYYMYECPSPGIILYQYRETAGSRGPSRLLAHHAGDHGPHRRGAGDLRDHLRGQQALSAAQPHPGAVAVSSSDT
jgi:Domain of unknown function (DUF4157)